MNASEEAPVYICLPGTDAVVVYVGGNDNSQSTQARLAMQHDYVLSAQVQPRLYRLAYVTQSLQWRRQHVRPTEIQHLVTVINRHV